MKGCFIPGVCKLLLLSCLAVLFPPCLVLWNVGNVVLANCLSYFLQLNACSVKAKWLNKKTALLLELSVDFFSVISRQP